MKLPSSEKLSLRFDHENDGKVSIDYSSCSLSTAIKYFSAIHEGLDRYSWESLAAEEGELLLDQSTHSSGLFSQLSEAHRLVNEEDKFALVTSALSSLGYLTTVRNETTVSHHHPLTAKSIFTAEEFAKAVRGFRKGLMKKKGERSGI